MNLERETSPLKVSIFSRSPFGIVTLTVSVIICIIAVTESEMNFGNTFQLPNVNCFIKKPIQNEKLIIKQVSETIGQSESLV
jgi:hypothetical protein